MGENHKILETSFMGFMSKRNAKVRLTNITVKSHNSVKFVFPYVSLIFPLLALSK